MRIATALIGAVLLAAGTGALLLGNEVLGPGLAARPVLDPVLGRYAAGHEWFWPFAGGVAGVAAVAGPVWFALRLRSAVRRRWPALDGPSWNLVNAAGAELLRATRLVPGVRDARVRFTGTRSRPRVLMNVTCDAAAVHARIRDELAAGPVERYRAAMAMENLIVVIRFSGERAGTSTEESVPVPA